MRSLLSIKRLRVYVTGKEVVHDIDLEIRPGEIHAIMGPNGSGKSSLVNALMGHPAYEVTEDKGQRTRMPHAPYPIPHVRFSGRNLMEMAPHERAQAGLFLAFQYPKEIAGVSLRDFLYAAMNARSAAKNGKRMSPLQFRRELEAEAKKLHIDPVLLERSVNKGFSGGEKKKAEILQLRMLKPRLALLDETDSGLDIDALRIIAEGVNALRGKDFAALVVTHYTRLLQYIIPDRVHVMVRGAIVESGGRALAHALEKEGYAKYGVREIHPIQMDVS